MSQFQNKNVTIGGFSYYKAKELTTIISISLGIIIFMVIPIIANKVQKPLTSAFLNVVPNGMILGFFIEEDKFVNYFLGLIFAPLINPLLNLSAYMMYDRLGLSAKLSLFINILIWALMVIIAYILNL